MLFLIYRKRIQDKKWSPVSPNYIKADSEQAALIHYFACIMGPISEEERLGAQYKTKRVS